MIRRPKKERVLLALALFAALAAAQGCSIPAVTAPGASLAADVRVTEQPAPIALRVKWVAPCGVHKTETFQFAGDEQTYMTTYSEAGGSYIGKTFWVEITWEDAEGAHRIESAAAECSV